MHSIGIRAMVLSIDEGTIEIERDRILHRVRRSHTFILFSLRVCTYLYKLIKLPINRSCVFYATYLEEDEYERGKKRIEGNQPSRWRSLPAHRFDRTLFHREHPRIQCFRSLTYDITETRSNMLMLCAYLFLRR